MKNEKRLIIITENHIFDFNLDVVRINELILQLQHVMKDIRRYEKVINIFVKEK